MRSETTAKFFALRSVSDAWHFAALRDLDRDLGSRPTNRCAASCDSSTGRQVRARAMTTKIVQLAPQDVSQRLAATMESIGAVVLGYGDVEVPAKHGRARGLAPRA